MNRDAFAEYHPLINFLFYIGALVGGMFFLHPAFVLCAVFFAALHYRIVKGRAAWHVLSGLLPLFIFLAVVNPVFNTYGDRVLFVWHIGNLIPERPYTMEALLYGMALGGMFISALLSWALEGGIATADSMMSRGYGCSRKRTSFSIYRFEVRDRLMLCGMAGLLLVLGFCTLQGGAQAEYTPGLSIAGPGNFYTIAGVVAYALFLAIPAGINLTEELKWHILRSKI